MRQHIYTELGVCFFVKYWDDDIAGSRSPECVLNGLSQQKALLYCIITGNWSRTLTSSLLRDGDSQFCIRICVIYRHINAKYMLSSVLSLCCSLWNIFPRSSRKKVEEQPQGHRVALLTWSCWRASKQVQLATDAQIAGWCWRRG